MDTDGEEIPDAVFQWRVEPITGYGTVYQSRDGRVATLEFVDFDLNGNPFQPPPGECQLSATVSVGAVTVNKVSDTIELMP